MSNYRVRQVLALCKRHPRMSPAEKDLMIGLATWLGDDSVEVRLSNGVLAEASALHPDTVKSVKRRLREKGWIDYEPAASPRERTLYRVPILEGGISATPPSTLEGGVSATSPSALTEGGAEGTTPKGGSEHEGRGGREGPEGGVAKSADQRERDHKLNTAKPQAKDLSQRVREAIRAAVADATDDETDTYARKIEDEHHPDNLARYIHAFPPSRITEGITELRRATAGQRPSDVPFAAMCSRCGARHDGTGCLERQPPPEPRVHPVTAAALVPEMPCAAAEKCRQKHTRVPDGRKYHVACETLGTLRAASLPAKGTDHDPVGRRIAAEQLAEMRAADPSQAAAS